MRLRCRYLVSILQVKHLSAHPLFRRLTASEQDSDPVVAKLFESSEEGQKVSRNQGQKWCAVFERVQDQL